MLNKDSILKYNPYYIQLPSLIIYLRFSLFVSTYTFNILFLALTNNSIFLITCLTHFTRSWTRSWLLLLRTFAIDYLCFLSIIKTWIIGSIIFYHIPSFWWRQTNLSVWCMRKYSSPFWRSKKNPTAAKQTQSTSIATI